MVGDLARRWTLHDITRYVRHEYRNLLLVFPLIRLKARVLMDRFRRRHSNSFQSEIPIPTVINLPFRPERLERIHNELVRLGFPKYFVEPAVPGISVFPKPAHLSGKKGCAASHLNVLQRELHSQTPILVLEDDVEFVADSERLAETVQKFLANPALDVLCLHNSSSRSRRMDDTFAYATDITSTAAYILKPRAVRHVLREFRKSLNALKGGKNFPIDHAWWRVQRWRLIFVIPNSALVSHVGHQSDTAFG